MRRGSGVQLAGLGNKWKKILDIKIHIGYLRGNSILILPPKPIGNGHFPY
jgi:hypothetical protein